MNPGTDRGKEEKRMPEKKNKKTDQKLSKEESVLVTAALSALKRSYAPYSRFHVAAALLCASGDIYTGVNVENASFPASLCAERSAAAQAVSAGEKAFKAIAIAGEKEGEIVSFTPPCGVCRQVLREFCDPEKMRVILIGPDAKIRVRTLEELLPESFGPENLAGI